MTHDWRQLENSTVTSDTDLNRFEDRPDPSEMDLILEAIEYDEWEEHFPSVEIAYEAAREFNAEAMDAEFERIRKQAPDVAEDLLETLEDIGTPQLLKTQAWLD